MLGFMKAKSVSKPDFENYTSFLNEGITIRDGTIKGVGAVKIDGIIFGDIDIDGSIVIGETGYIKGNVNSTSLMVAGKLEGDVHVSGLVHLCETCNVQGNIECNLIKIDQSAIFCGSCSMTGKNEKRKPTKADQKEEKA